MLTLKNQAQLMGHLGIDPHIKMMEPGKKLVRFSVASNKSCLNAGIYELPEIKRLNMENDSISVHVGFGPCTYLN